MGYGRKLYHVLEAISTAQNILNLNVCIGYQEVEDEYLTANSAQFHAHLGYHMVGEFHKCGYKFGRWYNMVWMEKWIGGACCRSGAIHSFSRFRTKYPKKFTNIINICFLHVKAAPGRKPFFSARLLLLFLLAVT